MNDIFKKILSENRELLSLPQTLAEVLRVVRDEKSSAQELSDILLRDPALTAKVLRIVNSPFYGLQREVSSMHQAVVTLGTRQVTALALSSSVYNLTNSWQSSIDRTRFWRHSLEVAIAARLLAHETNWTQTEEVFVSGLLHDIGLLIIEKSFPEDYARIRSETARGESVIDLEEDKWGTNHAKVGQFLLEQWNLPEAICTAVGHHHDLFAEGTSNPEVKPSQITCLGNLLSQFSIGEQRPPQLLFEAENREIICGNLGITADRLATVQKQLFSQTIDEARYLEMEIGSPEQILIEANRMLFDQYMAVEQLLRENRKLNKQIRRDQRRRVAIDSMGNMAMTLNKRINAANASIIGRVQLVQSAVQQGQLHDPKSVVSTSMQEIIEGVEAIGSLMKELTNLACLDPVNCVNENSLPEIEDKIKRQIEQLEVAEPAL